MTNLFDAYYYECGCGGPYERNEAFLQLFDHFAGRIASDIAPQEVLDAGCAMGYLVDQLRKRGISAWGVDISEYAIQHVPPDIREYCWADSITVPFSRRYDLIVSIEVVEHMSPCEAELAIANFCQHSDDILFSSTPFDYKEVSHFNVQSPDVWAEMFARHGFYRDVDFDATFITPWAVRYRRSDEPMHRIAKNYERRHWQIVKENFDLRSLSLEMRQQLAENDLKLKQQENASLQPVDQAEQTQEMVTLLQEQLNQKDSQLREIQSQLFELKKAQSGKAWRLVTWLRNLRSKFIPPGG